MELCLPKLLNPLLNPNSKHRSQDTWLLCPEPSAGAGDHRCCKWRVGRWQGCCLDELHQGWILSIRNMFRSNDYYLCIINFHFLFKAKKSVLYWFHVLYHVLLILALVKISSPGTNSEQVTQPRLGPILSWHIYTRLPADPRAAETRGAHRRQQSPSECW